MNDEKILTSQARMQLAPKQHYTQIHEVCHARFLINAVHFYLPRKFSFFFHTTTIACYCRQEDPCRGIDFKTPYLTKCHFIEANFSEIF